MNILTHLKSGAFRSFKSWKGVLVIWVLTLFLISLLALPMKSGFKSMIGSSMITELLTDTVNVDVITDFMQGLSSLLPALTSGFMLILFLGFLMNAFLTGGLFTILSGKNSRYSVSHLFAGGAANFWSVLVITIIIVLIILVSGSVIGGIPMMIIRGSGEGTPQPGAMGKAIRISMIILALVLPVLLLVSDYARAWQVTHEEKKPFKAIGFGFSTTFRNFLKSYPMMLILMAVQAGFSALVVSKLLGSKPATGGSVFLLFVASQIIFIIRIMFRAWRYGSVTSLMEEKTKITTVVSDQKVSELWPSI